jgi:serine/threonine protein kinase
MESLLETRLSGYVLKRLIAAGGMAAVFEAEHELTGQVVAIKVLSRDLRNKRDPLARILQEGRAICSLLHEHVVRVYDYGTADEGVGFIVMERLHGRSLAEVLDDDGVLEPQRIVFIGRQVCLGLAAAHNRGIYHRDIKPGNIMLVEGQRYRDFVKVLDFGVAKLEADDPAKLAATATGMTLGTPQYMSPEQASAGRIDARSDIYQVGLLLYEALVGEPPFLDRNPVTVMTQHLAEPPRPPSSRRVGVPEGLERIIMRCLEKAPEDRYPTAAALRADLDALAVRDTGSEELRTFVATHDRRETLAGNLRLPTLGNPADLERYARNLSEVLDQLWPDGVPEELRVLQGALWSLTEEQMRLGTDLALAREDADSLARRLEERLQPLERALEALRNERQSLVEAQAALDKREQARLARTAELDAEYAEIYARIEQHQSALYGRAGSGGPVDFRDLFRADIASQLERLEKIFRQRSAEAEKLNALRREMAELRPRIADIDVQIAGLDQSRLGLEAERAAKLIAKDSRVTDLDNRHRAVERAVEHRYLQLGIAFRKAVSALLAERA